MSDAESGVFALNGLTSTQLYELGDWFKLYTRKYPCVGHVPGVYWSPMGDPSEMLLDLVKTWNNQPPGVEDLSDLLPPCNSFFDGKVLRLTCSLFNRLVCALDVLIDAFLVRMPIDITLGNYWSQKKPRCAAPVSLNRI